MPLPSDPVEVPTNVFNPGTISLETSGSTTSSITQDWWVHIQTIEIMYNRNNKYDLTTSSPTNVPVVTFNYLDAAYTVQTTDEIWRGATFSGELWEPQTLELITQGASAGGFGTQGVVNTSTVGYIRRKVRTDAAGNVLDPTGICTNRGNIALDKAPGAYTVGYDTSSQVNGQLQYAVGQVAIHCPSFKATLVNL